MTASHRSDFTLPYLDTQRDYTWAIHSQFLPLDCLDEYDVRRYMLEQVLDNRHAGIAH